jgi:hypothetical protein
MSKRRDPSELTRRPPTLVQERLAMGRYRNRNECACCEKPGWRADLQPRVFAGRQRLLCRGCRESLFDRGAA